MLSNYSGVEKIGTKFISRDVIVSDQSKDGGNHVLEIVIGTVVPLLLLVISIFVVIAIRYPRFCKMKQRTNRLVPTKSMSEGHDVITMSQNVNTADEEIQHISEPQHFFTFATSFSSCGINTVSSGQIKQCASSHEGKQQPLQKTKDEARHIYENLKPCNQSDVAVERPSSDLYCEYIDINFINGSCNCECH